MTNAFENGRISYFKTLRVCNDNELFSFDTYAFFFCLVVISSRDRAPDKVGFLRLIRSYFISYQNIFRNPH